MNELSVTKLFLDAHTFNKYSQYLISKNLEPEHKIVLQSIGQYFNEYPDKRSLTTEELKLFVHHINPNLKNSEQIDGWLDKLNQSQVNPGLLKDMLKALTAKYHAHDIAEELIAALDGDAAKVLAETLPEKIIQYKDEVQELEDIENPFCQPTVQELIDRKQKLSGYRWRIDELNRIIGPIRGGVLAHIIARSDTGKTTFAISEATYFAKQLVDDECILYFCNEEQVENLAERAKCAVLKRPWPDIEANPQFASQLDGVFVKRNGDRVKFTSLAHHISQIQAGIEEYHPKLVIIDQGPKLNIYKQSQFNGVERLKELFTQLRRIAQRYNIPVISIGQADAAAEGRKWIGMSNIAGNKVDVAGELDLMIGIGRTNNPDDEAQRFFWVHKNKLTSRNGRFAARYYPDLCLVTD